MIVYLLQINLQPIFAGCNRITSNKYIIVTYKLNYQIQQINVHLHLRKKNKF